MVLPRTAPCPIEMDHLASTANVFIMHMRSTAATPSSLVTTETSCENSLISINTKMPDQDSSKRMPCQRCRKNGQSDASRFSPYHVPAEQGKEQCKGCRYSKLRSTNAADKNIAELQPLTPMPLSSTHALSGPNDARLRDRNRQQPKKMPHPPIKQDAARRTAYPGTPSPIPLSSASHHAPPQPPTPPSGTATRRTSAPAERKAARSPP